jgi:hypothetical protein
MSAHSNLRLVGVIVAVLVWLWADAFSVSAQPVDDVDDLQSSFAELDQYGRWIDHPEWGTVWSPDVDEDWRPYTIGRWVYTEEHGWYWDSDEPFGWAVYHYGRWFEDEQEGWLWVPGTEWGPAWVAWRYGEDAVGWAPLPPRAVWDPGRGVVVDDDFYSGARYAPYWIFLAPRYLMTAGLHRFVLPAGRNTHFFGRTRPATRYEWEGRRIFNHGIARGEAERLSRTRVAPLALMPSSRPHVGRRSAGAVYAYRPAIVPSSRWQSGRGGDWRRFEPASRPPAARPDFSRDRIVTPRRESPGDMYRRPDNDFRRDRDAGRSFDRAPSERSYRDRGPDRQQPMASPPPAAPRFQRPETRPGPRPDSWPATRPEPRPVPRNEPDHRSFQRDRSQDGWDRGGRGSFQHQQAPSRPAQSSPPPRAHPVSPPPQTHQRQHQAPQQPSQRQGQPPRKHDDAPQHHQSGRRG